MSSSQQESKEAESPGTSSWSRARQVASEANTQAAIDDLERYYVNVKQERDDLQQQMAQAKEQLASANESVASKQALEREMAEIQHELSLAKNRVKALDEEKKIVEERMDRTQAEADSLREEINRLTKSNEELSKNMADHEIQAKIKESEAIPLFHEKQRLQTDLDSLQAHSTWLEQELQAKTQDYQKLQQESRDRAIQLQLQLDQVIGEKDAAEARVDELQRMERRLQNQVEDLSSDILAAKQDVTDLRETTEFEVREERRVVEVQKEHLHRWEIRYNDVVRENESLKQAAAEAIKASKLEIEKESEELEHKYRSLLKEQAAEYEEKLKAQGRLESEPRPRAALPAASGGESGYEQDEGPLSLIDLYTRLEETKAALRQETTRADRAELMNERIMKDIAEKAPIMNRQREEYEMAMDQIQEYQRRLDQALTEKDDAREDSKEARQEASRLQKLLSDKKAESQELANQVQALLVSRAGGQVAGDIPTSVAEIQNQNQRLLVEHRRLTQTVSELEDRLQTDTLKAKLESTEAELITLQEERKRQEVAVERIIQQRDLYRAILNKHDSNLLGSEAEEATALEMAKQQSERAKKVEQKNKELGNDLATARGEIDRIARDKEAMAERLSRYEAHRTEMRDLFDQSQRELLSARGDVARMQSESKYHREKAERLEESLQRTRDEVMHLTSAQSELQRINAELQQSLSSANAESARAASEKKQVEMKLRLAETRTETARTAENRMTEENNQLRAEVARQGSVIDSIRRIESSLSAKSEVEKESLKETVERLSQLRTNEQSKYSVEIENLTGRIHELEARLQDSGSNREKAQSDSLKAKKALLEMQTEKQTLASKLENVEAQLRSAKRKLGETGDGDDVEVVLQSRIDSLTSELESARSEKVAVEQRASTYEKMAKDAESALRELQNATDELKAAQGTELEDLKNQIESMKQGSASKDERIAELTKDLSSQEEAREKLERELRTEISSLKAEMDNSEKDGETSKATVAAMKMDLETLRTELATTQDNYERELQLHSQARTSLRTVREQAQEETRLRLSAEEQLDSLKREMAQHRETWEQEKASMRETSSILEKSLKEAREQNSVLHSQLESLGEMVEKNQQAKASSASEMPKGGESTDEAGNMQKVISELREVVRFLRSENQMIQSQFDAAKRTADRERASYQVVKRSLDEARAELKTLQSEQQQGDRTDAGDSKDFKDKLQASEEQLALLRDSNKLLRDEVQKLQATLASTQEELDSVRKSALPAEKIQRELETKTASLEAEKDSLARELGAWKGRVDSLVSKFNQIDPEEHDKALKQIEDLKKEKQSLSAWKKTTEEENTRIREIARNLNQKLREQKSLIDSQKKEIEKLTAEKKSLASASSADSSAAKERDQAREKLARMESDLASTKTELDGANTRNDKFRERLRQFQTTIRELKGREKTLTEQLSAAQASTATPSAQGASGETPAAAGTKRKLEPPAKAIESKKQAVVEAEAAPNLEQHETIPTIPAEGFKFGPSAEMKQTPMDSEEKESIPGALVQASSSSLVVEAPKSVASSVPSLRADAAAFEPSKPIDVTARKKSQRKKQPTQTAPSRSEELSTKPEASKKPEPPKKTEPSKKTEDESQTAAKSPEEPAVRRSSGEKKEMSFKEKLLEKKRKLALAVERKRKMEAEMAAKKAETDKDEAQATKRAKLGEEKEKEEAPAAKEPQGLLPTPAAPATGFAQGGSSAESITAAVATPALPPATSETLEAGGEKEKAEAMEEGKAEGMEDKPGAREETLAEAPREEKAEVQEGKGEAEEGEDVEEEAEIEDEGELEEEADAEEDVEAEEVDDDEPEEPKKADTPFGGGTNPPGAGVKFGSSSFGGSTAFGQSSSLTSGGPTTFGSKTTAPSSSAFGSGAFLDIKPPGSSTAPPTFSFGTSSTIKLPTPSQPAQTSASPFGAFGGSSGFGGFGTSSAQSFGPRPLFGAPAQPEQKEEKEEDAEEMADGENELKDEEYQAEE